MSEVRIQTRYARSRDGRVIHYGSCEYARYPWQWAEGKTAVHLAVMADNMGYRACKVCRPFDQPTLRVVQ